MKDKRFLLTCVLKQGGSTFMWFDSEEELLWTIKNVTTITPLEAFEIESVRNIKIDIE